MRVCSMAVLLWLAAETGLPARSTTTPFTLDRHGGIVVTAAFNGTGPYRVLLDTGANHSSISEDIVRRLGAPAIARGVVSSPAGEREYPIVRLDLLAIGPLSVAASPTAVPAAQLAVAGDIDGVVGQDVLSALRYTIDYNKRQIIWTDDISAERVRPGAVLRLTYEDGLPIVEIPHGDLPLRLVADSGAAGLLLFDSAARQWPGMRRDGGLVRVDTFQGSRLAHSVVIEELRIGPAIFQRLPAVLVESADSPAHRSDGLLPLHIFGRVTLDGPGRLLILG